MDILQEPVVDYIPTTFRKPPPTKFLGYEDGEPFYKWYITEDEYYRLCKIFDGRDFQEVDMCGTLVVGLPHPCHSCGKYTEFIDWVWTALQREVHTADYMFQALKDGRMPKENMHDVYCSQCGTLTHARSRNNAEGGAPNIVQAHRLRKSDMKTSQVRNHPQRPSSNSPPQPTARWGKWWLDDKGDTKAWRNGMQSSADEL